MLAIQVEEGEGKPYKRTLSYPQTSVPIPNVEDEAVFKEWDDRVVRATTTAASLDATQASGAKKPCEVPFLRLGLRGYLHRPMIHLSQELTHLEVMRAVKKLEKTVKSNQARRRAKIVISDDEEDLEDSSKQGKMIEEIDLKQELTFGYYLQRKKKCYTYTRRKKGVSTGSGEVSTASRLFSTAEESVSTAGASMPISTAGMVQEVNISIPSPVVVKDKGKGIMTDSEDEQTKRTKLQQEQDRLGHEEAMRLQEELDEEERQRMARVHAATQSFTKELWIELKRLFEPNSDDTLWKLQSKRT
ncbi:hypothetical protein Tco_1479808 [Tanacetum coccineum]